MSLYNMLHGMNPLSEVLLSFLGLTRGDVGRFRDCYLVDRNGEKQIAVYTRNGGGNRECWDGCEGNCPGCVIEKVLPVHELYAGDEDDDFDCTYATIYFRVPDFAQEIIAAMEPEKNTPADRWSAMFKALNENKTDSPLFKKAMEVGRPIIEKIVEVFVKPPADEPERGGE